MKNTIKVCIIDDNRILADGIKAMLKTAENRFDVTLEIYTFYDSNSFLESSHHNNTDICFLDIDLGEIDTNGLSLARYIKEANYHTLLIFMSGFDDYYHELVQVEPFRFLHKPITAPEIIEVFGKAYSRITMEEQNTSCIFKYSYNGLIFTVDLNTVVYLCSLKRKIYIHQEEYEVSEFYGKLDNVEKDIKTLTDCFLRINKSYLININFIENFGKNEVTIGDQVLTISPKYKESVKNRLKNL